MHEKYVIKIYVDDKAEGFTRMFYMHKFFIRFVQSIRIINL